jgi:hypothetical protein
VRGLSSEQIPVVVARDRNGHTVDAVLRGRSAREIGLRLGAPIDADSLLCIERSGILMKFARQSGLPFERIGAKQRRGREKVFHAQTVNACHSRLKNWMLRFSGVATRCLPNYLAWRRLHESAPASPRQWFRTIVKDHLHRLRN